MGTDSPEQQTEHQWKSKWEEEASPNTNFPWLANLGADHSGLPEQVADHPGGTHLTLGLKYEELDCTRP